jgi:hypothetical protein
MEAFIQGNEIEHQFQLFYFYGFLVCGVPTHNFWGG